MQETSIYIVLNEKLKTMETWRTPNIVFMLGMMLGTKVDKACVGPEVIDASGIVHAGIGNIVLPILSMKEAHMATFYRRCKEGERQNGINVFDFTYAAQSSTTYPEYEAKLAKENLEQQLILGIALLGPKKSVRSLCGSLPRWK